ncbi:signal recognition particle GTPase [Streptococcus pneumoniae]|nr:signal recognition particle GTPase [Streptococcus pneumoniae]
MEIQDYTDSEFKHALARNLRSLTRGKKSSKQPIAILLGGQSGAGKTTIHRIKQKEFQGNIVIIDGILNTIHFGFFQLPILLNGFQEIFKVMLLILFDLLRESLLKML